MKIVDLLEHYAELVGRARDTAQGLDVPVTATGGRLVEKTGTLSLYEFEIPPDSPLLEDSPVTVLPPSPVESTEGFVLKVGERALWVQTFESLGQTVGACTIVPDAAGLLETAAQRLSSMAGHPDRYSLGPAERLVPWWEPGTSGEVGTARLSASASIVTTCWGDDLGARRVKLVSLAVQLVRENKRLLLITPDHAASDELIGSIARAMRGGGMQFKSLLCRYEMPLTRRAAGMSLREMGFEAQVHQFYAKSRNEKATLRKKYERFRELTPLLAYKAEKQRDLDEVKLLEWRLLTQLNDLREKIKEIDRTVAAYEQLPLWKRLSMQTTGKNRETLGEYRVIYDGQVKAALAELDIAKARIEQLRPEAAIPKDLRPEYNELKEEIGKLGGTKKIRELLAASEGTNRQAFLQNRRLIATTAARVVTDPLFDRMRFDVLLVDEAPHIPSPYVLAAAGLVRERIVLSGDEREVPDPTTWATIPLKAVGQTSVA